MQKTTVTILGAGIVGSFIFDMLSIKGIKTILLEKDEDVSLGATKANSGIIHAGYDCEENSLKAKFNVRGNKMYPNIAKRLHEEIVSCGSLVVGNKDSLPKLQELLLRGEHNGVKNLSILNKDELHAIESHLSDDICYGLYAKDAKIISPYHFCISLCEEGIVNNGKLLLNFCTKSIKRVNNLYEISNGTEVIQSEYLINCTANNVNEINKLLNEKQYDITLTKGEYILLDDSEKGLVNRPIFPLPTQKGKGIIVGPTVHQNIFLGPTAVDEDEYDTSFSYDSLSTIKSQVVQNVKDINFRKTIKLYAGVRVKTGKDFVIDFSENNPKFVCVAGISSPGLSAAPAIAEYVIKTLEKKYGLKGKKQELKQRKPYTNILKMKSSELEALIERDKNYGEIVCNCERISKGEILEVLKGPISPLTTDGVKRRLRATMGHCQGAFCYSKLLNVMSKYYKVPSEEILMRGKSSLILSDIKEGGLYD